MTLQDTARKILSLIDLTSLNATDSDETILSLCQAAHTPYGDTAAVCVYPQFIHIAKTTLATQGTPHIHVATVTNFPAGRSDIPLALDETARAVEAGADEIDLVMPYLAIANKDTLTAEILISEAVRLINGQSKLKVILESGVLHLPELILLASEIAIDNGADFIKTSTGKVAVNATREAAYIMLKTIARKNPACGFKAAGGIRTVAEAQIYLTLAEDILGADWISPAHFRFGASALLQDVLSSIENRTNQADRLSY
jgi:deoxyribose-phosphate aldolase